MGVENLEFLSLSFDIILKIFLILPFIWKKKKKTIIWHPLQNSGFPSLLQPLLLLTLVLVSNLNNQYSFFHDSNYFLWASSMRKFQALVRSEYAFKINSFVYLMVQPFSRTLIVGNGSTGTYTIKIFNK